MTGRKRSAAVRQSGDQEPRLAAKLNTGSLLSVQNERRTGQEAAESESCVAFESTALNVLDHNHVRMCKYWSAYLQRMKI